MSLSVAALMLPFDASLSSSSHAENASLAFFTSRYCRAIVLRFDSNSSEIPLKLSFSAFKVGHRDFLSASSLPNQKVMMVAMAAMMSVMVLVVWWWC